MKYFIILIISIFVFGCSSKKEPEWRTNSAIFAEKLKSSHLSSDYDLAEKYYQMALREASKGGSFYDMQKIELINSAMLIATLSKPDFSKYFELSKVEKYDELMAYQRFLDGSFAMADINLLPPHLSSVAKDIYEKRYDEAVMKCMQLDKPDSALVGLGVVLRLDAKNEKAYDGMVEISKRMGYKKILFKAYESLALFYQANGQQQKLEAINTKIKILKQIE